MTLKIQITLMKWMDRVGVAKPPFLLNKRKLLSESFPLFSKCPKRQGAAKSEFIYKTSITRVRETQTLLLKKEMHPCGKLTPTPKKIGC